MNTCLLHMKRLMRTVWFPVLLVVLVLALLAACLIGEKEGLPPVGAANDDDSELSEKIMARLESMGFAAVGSEDVLREEIAQGRLDCGVLLPKGFGESLLSGDVHAVFLETPDSYVPTLIRNQAAAAIFYERARIVSSDGLDEVGVDSADYDAIYREMTMEGAQFTFEIVVRDGAERTAPEPRGLAYAMGALALLGFSAVMFQTDRSFSRTELAGRLGARNTLTSLLLPELLGAWFCLVCAVLLACFGMRLFGSPVGGMLALCSVCWITLAFSFAAAASYLLKTSAWRQGLAFAVLLFTPALCPIAWDAGLLVPAVGFVRLFLPTYWLWVCKNRPILGVGIAVLSLIPAALALLAQARRMAQGK
ncbi:MAG: hypothetical protein IKQ92_15245 [Clostridia bacterium]|nr:hypothetical protein [Clostridia bacterium]